MAAPRGSAVRRTGQVLTGFGALVLLVAVLAGGPVALLAFAGNPLPDHLPTLAEVGTALTSRDDGRLFLRALALVGWFGWATFAFSVLVELSAQALRRPAPRLPGMRRQQRAAAALVGSVALIIAASPAAAAATTLAGPYPAAAPPAATALASTAPVGAATATNASAAGAPAVYRVAKGDYLGEVAERYLDDFDRYRDVAKLNRLRDPDLIHPGQLLRLPDGASDAGPRRHATGRLVARPAAPAAPRTTAPRTTAPQPTAPQTTAPRTTAPQPTGPAAPAGSETAGSRLDRPAGPPPAMAAGAARATDGDRMNRPLAVSAVLAVASIVGAQVGAVLGLRGRTATTRTALGRALASGRHRRE